MSVFKSFVMFCYCLFFALFIIVYASLFFLNKKFLFSSFTIALITSMISTTLVHYASQKQTRKQDILKIGISPDYFPFTYINDDQKLSGFDIELIEEIAKKMGKNIEFKIMNFESLLPSLQLKQVDALIGGLAITEERKKNILATTSYLAHDPFCIITLERNVVEDINDIKNKRGITINGYSSGDYLLRENITTDIHNVKSLPEGLLLLDMQKGDFYIGSYIAASCIKNVSKKYNIHVLPNEHDRIGIFLHKNNIELSSTINTIIQELQDNGFLEGLMKKWNL